ncbi:hypothetical protein AYL99_04043 [Fonsecaea erecta]|uniref:Uncharacterized protein n=1 Tax=Fonsecaea erecta TaxID=1367422 RepID=A0A178ZPV7_9EURO|nr:hypothetical protein AYL99_04043 [Fonsecaea erecta]OAP61840.1 hypothetical protein AYL99_04043 [Fonsecaea erecta]
MSPRERDGAIARATKGIGSLIGLAVEAHVQRKNKTQSTVTRRYEIPENSSRATRSSPFSAQYDCREIDDKEPLSDDEDEDDEDAFADAMLPPSYDEVISPGSSGTAPFTTIKPLPYPIILPQRRPKRSSRGFIRAYAPVLQTHKNISQDAFLAFLKDFQRSSRASPVFHAINIGAMAAGFAPSAIAMGVSMGVQAGTKYAMAYQEKTRTNNYLDKANREMFWPVGLHAMITTFAPGQSDQSVLDVDTGRPLPSYSGSRDPPELAIPQSAPLIFPQVDDEVDDDGQPRSSWKRGSKFVSSYFDRRAQAEHLPTYGDPNSPPTFASRYSDPNHPANSGSPIALLTGGLINPRGDRSRGDQGRLLSTVQDLKRSNSHGDEGLLMRLARTVSDARSSPSQSDRYGQQSSYGSAPHSRSHSQSKSRSHSHSHSHSRESDDHDYMPYEGSRRPDDRRRRSHRRSESLGTLNDESRGRGVHGQGGRGGLKQVLRKATSMQQDVLYLVIAEIPDSVKEEMARSRRRG